MPVFSATMEMGTVERWLKAPGDAVQRGETIAEIFTDKVEESLSMTRRLLVVEEQLHAGGWGADLISEVARRGLLLQAPPAALSIADDVLIPYSPPLEDAVIPGKDDISEAVRKRLAV
jgi:pyruvate/2-oxoglutarate/acetoin dehydrogenase E1 component